MRHPLDICYAKAHRLRVLLLCKLCKIGNAPRERLALLFPHPNGEYRSMTVIYEERASESPFVRTIWRTLAVSDGSDIVTADGSWDMILVRRNDRTILSVWGPTTSAKSIPHLQGDECLGIRFTLGVWMPQLPPQTLLDLGVALPEATCASFWLGGSTWRIPTYENVDAFVRRLVRDDALVRDPLIDTVLQGHAKDVSLRSVQRHFLHATGLTQNAIRQIERAYHAEVLLQQGTPILDTVHQVGYADHAHLTRSLRRLIGRTPSQIAGTKTP